MGHVGSKSRSHGQILETFYVSYRGHIFCSMLLKFGQKVCYDKIENGSYGIKARSAGQIFKKNS